MRGFRNAEDEWETFAEVSYDPRSIKVVCGHGLSYVLPERY